MKKVRATGIGVHTPEEIIQMGKDDLQVLTDMLGDKTFFFGEEPTTVNWALNEEFHFLSPCLSGTKVLTYLFSPQLCSAWRRGFLQYRSVGSGRKGSCSPIEGLALREWQEPRATLWKDQGEVSWLLSHKSLCRLLIQHDTDPTEWRTVY